MDIYKRDKFNRICLVGGAQTFASYAKASHAQKLAHIEFLSNLQLYLEFAEFKNTQDRRLIVSHSVLGRMRTLRNSEGDSAAEFRRHVLCGRVIQHKTKASLTSMAIRRPLSLISRNLVQISIRAAFISMNWAAFARWSPSMRIFMQENIEDGG